MRNHTNHGSTRLCLQDHHGLPQRYMGIVPKKPCLRRSLSRQWISECTWCVQTIKCDLYHQPCRLLQSTSPWTHFSNRPKLWSVTRRIRSTEHGQSANNIGFIRIIHQRDLGPFSGRILTFRFHGRHDGLSQSLRLLSGASFCRNKSFRKGQQAQWKWKEQGAPAAAIEP